MSIDLNQQPWYDDFDKTKNFVRLVFNPSYAVQARELTQLQTILTNQIKSHADHIFKNGTPIIGCEVRENLDKKSAILDTLDTAGAGVNMSAFVGATIYKVDHPTNTNASNTGDSAVVTHVDVDTKTLLFNYLGGEFADGDRIVIRDPDDVNIILYDATISTGGLAEAITASIEVGIMYINGYFVQMEKSSVVVDWHSNDGTYHIGYSYNDSIVTPSDDSTLLDPANGSYNFNAIGADRYKIGTYLDSWIEVQGTNGDVVTTEPTDFYKLSTIENGISIGSYNKVQYNDIINLLARRTYDESGNYTTDYFEIGFDDDEGDETNIITTLSSGKGYVQGFEIEKSRPTKLNLPKATTTKKKTDESIYTPYGVYIDVAHDGTNDSAQGVFNIDEREIVTLRSGVNGTGSNIASTRIVAITRFGVNMRVWLEWIPSIEDFLTTTKSIRNPSNTVYVNTLPFSSSGQTKDHGLIFTTLRTPIESFDSNRISYTAQKSFKNIPVNGSTKYVITADSLFTDFVDGGVMLLALSSTDGTNPRQIQPSGDYTYVIAGNGNDTILSTLTITPTGFTADNIDVICEVDRRKTNAKTKTLTNVVADFDNVGTTSITLSHYDVYKITKIESKALVGDSYVEETDISGYTLNRNDKSSHYDLSSVDGLTLTRFYRITYIYFNHTGTGDCFTVDSYIHSPNITLEPTLYTDLGNYVNDGGETVDLINSIDFRRTVYDLDNVGVYTISPRTNISVDYNYYLSRFDNVSLSSKGDFIITSGIPSYDPEIPKFPQNVMPLYTLYVPAYTFNKQDIKIQQYDRQRFTMNDIRKLRDRIERLEYYSSLSILEKSATEMNIIDSSGFSKFKNGILVDNFSSHKIGNFENENYNCAIARKHGILRAPYEATHIDFNEVSVPAGIKENANSFTLDFTTTRAIWQPLSSTTINVNPFDVIFWEGNMELLPPIDNWHETQFEQTVNILGVNNTTTLAVGNTTSQNIAWNTRRLHFGSWTSSDTNILQQINAVKNSTAVTSQSAFGTLPPLTSSWSVETEHETVSRENIQFMRPINIVFICDNLKPNTQVDCFFDGLVVNAFVTPAGGNLGDPVVSDWNGSAVGIFSVPSGVFRTGTRNFELVDAVHSLNPYTSAETPFVAVGTLLTEKETLTYSYVQPQIFRDRRVDPLAQSFYIDEVGGAFYNSVDVYFQTKDDNLPVTLQLVSMENGYPTSNVIPNSTVIKPPADVSVSNDGSVATTFTFSDPIYLHDKTEYAFVVLAKTINYEVFVSELGGFDTLTGSRIVKQPYLGSLFTSQNATTWSAEQTKDLKFNIHKCVFSESSISMNFINDETSQTADIDTTLLSLKFDSINLSETNVGYTYQFTGDAVATPLINRKNKKLDVQSLVTLDGTTSNLTINATLSTTNPNLTPIVSKYGKSCILVNNVIADIAGEATYKDAGTYITKTVDLLTGSDSMHVYVDAMLPNASRLKVFYSTEKYIPKYVEVDAVSTVHSDFRTNIGYVYWHNTAGGTWTAKGTVVTTGVDDTTTPNRIYLSQISDYDMFIGSADFATNSITDIYICEQEVDQATIDDWNTSPYTAGQYAFYNDLLYVANVGTTNSIPSSAGSDWSLVKSTSTTTVVTDDVESSWREMELENVVSNEIDVSGSWVEYVYVPKVYPDTDFKQFAIKIEMQSLEALNIPLVRNFRAIAVM